MRPTRQAVRGHKQSVANAAARTFERLLLANIGHCMLLVRLLTEIAELGLAILLEATGSAKPLRGRCNQVAGGRTHAGLIVSERQRQFSPPIEIAPLEDQTVL
jgi:hypothetical protein